MRKTFSLDLDDFLSESVSLFPLRASFKLEIDHTSKK